MFLQFWNSVIWLEMTLNVRIRIFEIKMEFNVLSISFRDRDRLTTSTTLYELNETIRNGSMHILLSSAIIIFISYFCNNRHISTIDTLSVHCQSCFLLHHLFNQNLRMKSKPSPKPSRYFILTVSTFKSKIHSCWPGL